MGYALYIGSMISIFEFIHIYFTNGFYRGLALIICWLLPIVVDINFELGNNYNIVIVLQDVVIC